MDKNIKPPENLFSHAKKKAKLHDKKYYKHKKSKSQQEMEKFSKFSSIFFFPTSACVEKKVFYERKSPMFLKRVTGKETFLQRVSFPAAAGNVIQSPAWTVFHAAYPAKLPGRSGWYGQSLLSTENQAAVSHFAEPE